MQPFTPYSQKKRKLPKGDGKQLSAVPMAILVK